MAEFCGLILLGLALHQALLRVSCPSAPRYHAAILAVTLAALGLFQASGSYRIRHSAICENGGEARHRLVHRVPDGGAAMVLAKIADHYSRIWLLSTTWSASASCSADARRFQPFVRMQMAKGRFDVVPRSSGGPAAVELIHALEASGDNGIRIIGIFDDGR